MWRSDARNFNNDSNTTIHTNTSRPRHGATLDALPNRFRHICIDQLRGIRNMGKWLYIMSCFHELNTKQTHFYLQLSIGVAVLCLPWLRYAQPNLPRPIRVPMVFPIVYLLATAFVTIVPMIASPVETGYGCLMILTSIPVYLIFIAWKNKPKWFQHAMCMYLCQMTFVWKENSHAYVGFAFDFYVVLIAVFTHTKKKYQTNKLFTFRRINENSSKSDDGCSTKNKSNKGFLLLFFFYYFLH